MVDSFLKENWKCPIKIFSRFWGCGGVVAFVERENNRVEQAINYRSLKLVNNGKRVSAKWNW
jgi:hypothetical protein